MDAMIYHNPDCGTSRNTRATPLNVRIELHVISFLETQPLRALSQQHRAG